MLAIQKTQVDKAVLLLNAMGLQFHIKGDDAEWGAPIELPRPVLKRSAPINNYASFGHNEKIRAMKVGDVLVFDAADIKAAGFDVRGFSSNVSTRGVGAFGTGNFTTSFMTGNVECLRLA